jgi:hypothetical protein
MRILTIAILVACGGGDTPGGIDHSLTTCDISTGSNAGMTCERACATQHDETDIGCLARSNGTDVMCEGTFGLDGIIGCCIVLPGEMIVRFAECLQ